MHSGVQLLTDMLLKCYTLKGTLSLSKCAIAQWFHGFPLTSPLKRAMHRLPACLLMHSCLVKRLPASFPIFSRVVCQPFLIFISLTPNTSWHLLSMQHVAAKLSCMKVIRNCHVGSEQQQALNWHFWFLIPEHFW